jgi:pSer/pThr/pTyr-binding forkhead associated (FHA) protein
LYCTQCGHRNPQDSKFCAKCGHPLGEDSTAAHSPVEIEDETGEVEVLPLEELEAGQALLVVKRGPGAGSRFLIDKDVVVCGRHPESDVFLDDITVSRKHMELHRKAGSYSVHDQGSLNGTYVNGELVEQTNLANGDEVQVGKFKLVFFTAPE